MIPLINYLKPAVRHLGVVCLGSLFGIQIQASTLNKKLHSHDDEHHSTEPVFTRNEGQWEDKVKYKTEIPGGALFLRNQGLTYVFVDPFQKQKIFQYYYQHPPRTPGMDSVSPDLACHAFAVDFVNANPNPILIPEHPEAAYRNYFIGNNPKHWAGGVKSFHEVSWQELWPGISLKIYSKPNSLKYDFTLNAGANPNLIRLKYSGQEKLSLTPEGHLKITTSVNTVSEQAPIAWQTEGNTKIPLPCRYVLNGDEIQFEFPNGHRSDLPIIIDPVLIFSTYSGSFADNFGFTATYDAAGNLYSGGNVYALGFPATLGSFQLTFGGGVNATAYDAAILKYNPTGTALIYATYLGGFGGDQPHSMFVNANDQLVVMGTTEATDFPVTPGAYDVTHNGGFDIYVTVFNQAGTALIGSTFIGGAGDDGINAPILFSLNPGYPLHFQYADEFRGDVNADASNNIYVASCTRSVNFPSTPGSFQTAFTPGGTQEGCVFKLNPTATTLIYSTFLGGSGEDAAYSLGLTAAGTVYVAGGTTSNDFPISPTALNPTYLGGQADGFAVLLNPTGSAILNSTFVGTAGYDQCYFVQLSASGEVYVSGQTSGGTYPVLGAVYSNPNSGQFISRLDPNLTTLQLSTVFGRGTGNPDLSPSAFLVDRCGYVYFSGWGGFLANSSTVGLPVTANAFQPITDGEDFYLIVFTPSLATLQYATFMGGGISAEHVDGGTSRFDRNGIVYQSVCGGCGGNSDFPTTPGAWSNTNNSNVPIVNCNNAAFKFDFQLNPVNAQLTIAPSTQGCAPFVVNFTNNSTGATQYVWDFGDGTPLVYLPNATHTFFNAGTYTVTLVASDPAFCALTDTATATIVVAQMQVSGGGDTIVCGGQPITLTVNSNCPGCTITWSPTTGLSNPNISNPTVSLQTTTSYTVTVSGSLGPGCPIESITDTVNAIVEPSPIVTVGSDTFYCEGSGGVQLSSTVSGGVSPYIYIWTPNNGSLSDAFIPSPIANPDSTTLYSFYAIGDNGCRSNVSSLTVDVAPLPIVDAGNDLSFCEDSPGVFLNGRIVNAQGNYSVQWLPTTGLYCSTCLNTYVVPPVNTIYTLRVTSLVTGCQSDSTTLNPMSVAVVTVKPRPVGFAGNDTSICELDSAYLRASFTNAGPAYSFRWSPNIGMNDSSLFDPRVSPPHSIQYFLTVTSNGCESIADTILVSVIPVPVVSAGPTLNICAGDSIQLPGQVQSGVANQLLWQPGSGLNDSTLLTPMASPLSTQTYQLTGLNANCPGLPASVLVIVHSVPQPEAGKDTAICLDQDSIQLSGSFTGGTAPWRIDWSPVMGLNYSNILNPKVLPVQSQLYYLQVSAGTGVSFCTAKDSILITVFPSLDLIVNQDTDKVCEGEGVSLSANAGKGSASFQWSPITGVQSPVSPNTSVFPTQSGWYYILASEGQCQARDSVWISVNPVPDVAFTPTQLLGCVPFSLKINDLSSGVASYTWDFGDQSPFSNEKNPIHEYNLPGEYQIRLWGRSSGACLDSLLYPTSIVVLPELKISALSDPPAPFLDVLPQSAEIRFTSKGDNIQSWFWDLGDGTLGTGAVIKHQYNYPGTYFVMLRAESSAGCVNTYQLGPYTLSLPEISIPNVFTPNGDGVNDLLFSGYTGDQNFNWIITDRWGVKQFESRNANEGWDGKDLNGQVVTEGVYFYSLTIGQRSFSGNISLIR